MEQVSIPPGDANLLKQAAKQYDKKAYSKALKTAESFLERYPKNAYCLALKAKTQHQLGKTDEAFVTVKAGLKSDLKNSDCWETLGVLHRYRCNFSEATSCFAKALIFNPDSIHCLTNLGSLYSHLRNLPALLKVRHSLLIKQPAAVNNWAGYAVAAHLNGDLSTAIDVIQSLLVSEALKSDLKPYDISQLILYKVRLLMEQKQPSAALSYLALEEGRIKNKLKVMRRRAEILIKLNRFDEAHSVVLEILKRNTEDSDVHELLKQSVSDHISEYRELQIQYSASHYIAKTNLALSSGTEFARALDIYIITRLRKGVPSLVNDLKSYKTDSVKADVIDKLLESHRASLRDSGTFANVDYENWAWTPGERKELPCVYLWSLYLSAWFCYFKKSYEAGLALCEEAIQHTPTLPDLFIIKSKLQTRLGNLLEAAESADHGKRLDMNDRYLSNYSAKLWLRANNPTKAHEVMLPFCKEIGEELNVKSMQNCWYELEKGKCHLRLGELAEAKTEFEAVWTHFDEYGSGQFDYHNYSLHKVNLEEYIDFIQALDGVYRNDQARQAGVGLLQCHLLDPTIPVTNVISKLAKFHTEDREVRDLISRIQG